jgi:hypothetical protein
VLFDVLRPRLQTAKPLCTVMGEQPLD